MPLTKKDLRSARTKEAIKSAALELAEEGGWSRVSIRKIADRILYSAPVVYEHFESKDDLYRHLVKDGFEELTEQTFQAMETVEDPEGKLLRLAEVRFDFASARPTLFHIMFDADHPEWQKLELMRSMMKLKDYVFELLEQITKDKQQVPAYFLNMIALVKGYVYFNGKMDQVQKLKEEFHLDPADMKTHFLEAIQRFLQTIKSQS